MKAAKLILFSSLGVLLIWSCKGTKEAPGLETSLIEITGKQFVTDGMNLGQIENKAFENIVKSAGTIVPLSGGKAMAGSPLPGIIRSVLCRNGELVQKNQPLLGISGTEVIDIQKEYAEAAALYHRLKKEYERAKALYKETVTSEKDFVVSESNYLSVQAVYTAAKLKVKALGLDTEQIESGNFYEFFTIKSPIAGYVSGLDAAIGQYIDPQTVLAEITDPGKVQLKLSVFSGDVSRLKVGQMVRFKPLDAAEASTARISAVGVSVDADSKTILCYADVDKNQAVQVVAGGYTEAEIVTASEVSAALPTAAILKTETGNAVLVLEKQEKGNYYFRKAEINTGRQNNGYTEVLGELSGRILTSGAYNVAL